MGDRIQFGTDGWRGVIGEDFTFETVRRVVRAIADHVKSEGEPGRGLVVGYDTRFLSSECALLAAETLAGEGIPAILAERESPTPAVSHAVVARRTAGAVVITASHNPYRWNGVKFKAPYGGSAGPRIMNSIARHLRTRERSEPKRKRTAKSASIDSADLIAPYLERLTSLVNFDCIRASGRRFAVDPMFGAARGCLAQVFTEAGVECREVHGEHNPLFPGLNPEPIEPHVSDLRRAVVEGGYDAGFAVDGDADRVGAIDHDGAFVDSHRIFSVLLRHLAEDLKLRGEVVKTFSTTKMIDRLCAKYGLPLHTTPIGFKHVAELILTRDVLIGGEESGGICVRGDVPERDGILNSLLLAEVVALRNKRIGELVAELHDEFGPLEYGRIDLEIDKRKAQAFVRRALRLKGKSFAGHRVREVCDLDGVKLVFDDSTWLLVRASGTENVLRLYAEAPMRREVTTLLAEMKSRVTAGI